MTEAPAVREAYLATFEAFEAEGAAGSPSWLREVRREAIGRFAKLGFPSTREEDWKYTNVAPIANARFEPRPDGVVEGIGRRALDPFEAGAESWTRLVLVNGRHAAALSSGGSQPGGARVEGLAGALGAGGDVVEAHLGRHVQHRDGFAALNTAFFPDGALVHVPEGVVVDTPIHLVFLAVPGSRPRLMAQPRNLIVLGAGSRATVVESYRSFSPDAYLTNAVTEVAVGHGAVLDHYKIQQEGEGAFHVGTLHVAHGRDSSFSSSSVALGGRLVRNTLQMLFEAEGGACTLGGLYVVGGRQHVDNHITVDHAAPRCTSRQLYKGILDGRSKAIFNGRILVRRGAQKTDAHQTNKNLLLADGPEVNSKPWLEIFADDVKCTHGAADGQLAEDAVFYLKSRGLSEAGARMLLTYGFANEVVERIAVEPLRTHLHGLLLERLQKRHAAKEGA